MFARPRDDTAEGYFLAGRTLVWLLIGISLFASNISSTTLVGLAGDAYATGISVFNHEWMAALVLGFHAVFMLPMVIRARVFTMPEFLERRFDRRVRSIFAALTLFLNIVVDTAGSLYAGAVVFQLVFPDVPLWQFVAGLDLMAGLYTAAAGLTAVIWTDASQGVLLLVGSVVISLAALDHVGRWSEVVAAVPAEELSLIRSMAHPMGPLTLADLIGLDICLDILNVLHEGFGDSKCRPCPLLRKMVDAGDLGRGLPERKPPLLFGCDRSVRAALRKAVTIKGSHCHAGRGVASVASCSRAPSSPFSSS